MAGADYSVPFFLNGKEHHTEKRFDIKSPVTGDVLHSCSSATAQDVTNAVESASEAFKTWRTMTPSRRRDIFLKAAEVMESRREELAQDVIDETGASPAWAGFNLHVAIDMIKDVAGRISSVEGTLPSTADEGLGAMVLKEPFGVVLAIAPWYVDATSETVGGLRANTI